jgi:uncharacterized protein YndB with AHSA1/START domain
VTHPTTITAQPGSPFLTIVREFDASPAAVYRAHTQPELYRRWLGPRTMRIDQLELDATVGGRWAYTFRGDGDTTFGFFGVFHAVEPDALLVQTFEFNLAPGQVGVSSTRFDAAGAGSRIELHEIYPSVEARDAALASGMEFGVREGYERLDELVSD